MFGTTQLIRTAVGVVVEVTTVGMAILLGTSLGTYVNVGENGPGPYILVALT